jgi:hypothetical protein
VCTPRLWCGGRTHSLGGEGGGGGGGSIFGRRRHSSVLYIFKYFVIKNIENKQYRKYLLIKFFGIKKYSSRETVIFYWRRETTWRLRKYCWRPGPLFASPTNMASRL